MAAADEGKYKSLCDKLLVAAIDFGTTYSGYAFSFKHEYEKEPTKVASNNWTAGTRALVSLKTPTTILLKPNKTFDSFGYEAEDKYSDLALDEEHTDWYYFRRFKMMLFDKTGLKRNVQLSDVRGRQMPALTIFSMGIQYLKDHLLKTLHNRATGITEEDIQWVLTVPAIWNDNAKQFMREAAEKAGIKGDQLLIALEPEAASMYCMHLPVDRMKGAEQKGGSHMQAFAEGTKYMVVDVGGGTVDISLHQVLAGGALKELYKASGGAWGGTMVDDAFKNLLIKIVGKQIMDKLSVENTSDYVDMFREFETKKRNIKADVKAKVTFKVPISLKELFEEEANTNIKKAIDGVKDLAGKLTWSGDKVRIEGEVMKGLFDVSCQNIVQHVRKLLREKVSVGANTILMVGGFSESPLLQETMKESFKGKRVIIPEDAGLAVLKGAVLFGHNPKTIKSRIAKCSYGIRVYRDFEPGVHPNDKKITADGKMKCKDVFASHVRKGDELVVGEAQTSQRYTPLEADQTSLIFDIYTSTDPDSKFVTDNCCTYAGQLEVKVPNVSGGKDRAVWVKMEYSGTEITVEAKEEKPPQRVQTATFQFLE